MKKQLLSMLLAAAVVLSLAAAPALADAADVSRTEANDMLGQAVTGTYAQSFVLVYYNATCGYAVRWLDDAKVYADTHDIRLCAYNQSSGGNLDMFLMLPGIDHYAVLPAAAVYNASNHVLVAGSSRDSGFSLTSLMEQAGLTRDGSAATAPSYSTAPYENLDTIPASSILAMFESGSFPRDAVFIDASHCAERAVADTLAYAKEAGIELYYYWYDWGLDATHRLSKLRGTTSLSFPVAIMYSAAQRTYYTEEFMSNSKKLYEALTANGFSVPAPRREPPAYDPSVGFTSAPPLGTKVNVGDSGTALPADYYDAPSVPSAPATPTAPTTPTTPTAPGHHGGHHSFHDVPGGCYYENAVIWAVDQDITKGTDAAQTEFSPDRTCSVAEILTFIHRAKGKPENMRFGEPDGVSPHDYCYDAAVWAYRNNLIGKHFDPNQPCTRAMVVEYLWKSAGSPAPAGANRFTDLSDADAAAALWAVEKGITNGTNDAGTTFSPGRTCTRAEIMTFLHRAYG